MHSSKDTATATGKRRQPGSDRGRPACDWAKAFIFWAALPAERRSYAAVAAEFGVSVRTVERHGCLERWQHRLGGINEQAAAETDARLAQEKAALVGRLRMLIGATLTAYTDRLRRDEIRISPADLDRLLKLWQQLDQELDSPPRALSAESAPVPARSAEQAAAVVQALAESGALTELGLQIVGRHDNDNQTRDDDEGGE